MWQKVDVSALSPQHAQHAQHAALQIRLHGSQGQKVDSYLYLRACTFWSHLSLHYLILSQLSAFTEPF